MRKNNDTEYSSVSQKLEHYQSIIEKLQAENLKIQSQVNDIEKTKATGFTIIL